MSRDRKPAAFAVEPQQRTIEREQPRRAPHATSDYVVAPAEVDVFDREDDALAVPPPATSVRRRSRLSAIFFGALGLLVSLAVGIWVDGLIRELFTRADWLGWAASAAAAIALVTLLALIVRETTSLWRLASVEKMRRRAEAAIVSNDPKAARALVGDLVGLLASRPETAAGRRTLAEQEGQVIDGADLIRLAETDLIAPIDEQARRLVLDAAKRVSLVTAVSPRALVDIAYVAFESARMIRRISELYGARPGTLGFLRLARNVLGHLAVTGSMAVSDSFVHELVGQGLAARLSAKLGEGVVNGMMTARIGIAAIDTARPLPFSAVRQPRMADFLSALTKFASSKETRAS